MKDLNEEDGEITQEMWECGFREVMTLPEYREAARVYEQRHRWAPLVEEF